MKKINRIKEVLVMKDKTQVWLSEQVGKEVHTVSLWCTNKRQPNLMILVLIADKLEVDVRELLIPTR